MYYKIYYESYNNSKFDIEECNIKKYGFCDTKEAAIERYQEELDENILSIIDDLIETRNKQNEFLKWKNNE